MHSSNERAREHISLDYDWRGSEATFSIRTHSPLSLFKPHSSTPTRTTAMSMFRRTKCRKIQTVDSGTQLPAPRLGPRTMKECPPDTCHYSNINYLTTWSPLLCTIQEICANISSSPARRPATASPLSLCAWDWRSGNYFSLRGYLDASFGAEIDAVHVTAYNSSSQRNDSGTGSSCVALTDTVRHTGKQDGLSRVPHGSWLVAFSHSAALAAQ